MRGSVVAAVTAVAGLATATRAGVPAVVIAAAVVVTALVVTTAIVVVAGRDGGGPCAGDTDAARILGVLGLLTRAAQVLVCLVGAPTHLVLATAVVLPGGRGVRGHRRERAARGRALARAEARRRAGERHARQQEDASDDRCDLEHALALLLSLVSVARTGLPAAGSGRASRSEGPAKPR